MRGHIVTVCMVCLLCAAHSHCALHAARIRQPKAHTALKGDVVEGLSDPNRLDADTVPLPQSRLGDTVPAEDDGLRTKRDAAAWDDEEYIRKMFNMFSNGNTMTVAGFERLLKAIGIERLPLPSKQTPSLHSVDGQTLVSNSSSSNRSVNCVNANEWVAAFTESQGQPHDGSWTQYNSQPRSKASEINSDSYKKLCPILLYQASQQGACNVHSSEIDPHHHTDSGERVEGGVVKDNMTAVWMYSTLSIVIISLCGLLGVAVIPVMQKVFYQKLIQFLVALAVGTLCGDALLHLLPHAMVTVGHDVVESSHTHSSHSNVHLHSQDHHHHTDSMWKGLAAAIGVVFFFLTEKGLTICAEWRKQRQRKSRTPVARVRVVRDTDEMNNSAVGEKLCKHKYSSYPYCYGDITKDGVVSSDLLRVEKNGGAHQPRRSSYPNDSSGDPHSADHLDSLDNHSNHNHLESSLNSGHKIGPTQEHRLLEKTHDTDGDADMKPDDKDYTIIIREHQSHHHGHSHMHGHVHSAPHSLSSVAWMVIMGDGLHNFTDGMAIGAAFANNIAGGFSTAVAVFCHELPHELGDFAVLLKAGMSARQAVFYNILSSVLGFLGMCTGILLGDTKAASGWIFAIAAGMFLYIALVDMIPELSSSHSVEGRSFCQCLLQFLGLTTGIGIMLLIAYYEDELMRTFSD